MIGRRGFLKTLLAAAAGALAGPVLPVDERGRMLFIGEIGCIYGVRWYESKDVAKTLPAGFGYAESREGEFIAFNGWGP